MYPYAKSKEWAAFTIYEPFSGAANDVVYHADYASLAGLENEMNATNSDAGFMEIVRRQASNIVQGSSVSEILMTIGDVA